jgi:GTP-binding protein HflX
MEEAASANLVLHVINLAHPHVEEQRDVGRDVLRDLGIGDERVLEVYNKLDAVEQPSFLERTGRDAVSVSALTGHGLGNLIERIRQRQLAGGELLHLDFPAEESRLAALIHEVGLVRERREQDGRVLLSAWVPGDLIHQFDAYRMAEDESVETA